MIAVHPFDEPACRSFRNAERLQHFPLRTSARSRRYAPASISAISAEILSAALAEPFATGRRQYELVEAARHHGFRDVEAIDDDLGRTADGVAERPLALICEDVIGVVLCVGATRLVRNGWDWEPFLEVCGFVGARINDLDGV